MGAATGSTSSSGTLAAPAGAGSAAGISAGTPRGASMPRSARARAVVALAAIALAGAAPAPAAAADESTITGSLGRDLASHRVVLLTVDGAIHEDRADDSGAFRIRAPRAEVKRSTLHVMSPSGDHLGPVVLGVQELGDQHGAHLRLAGASAALGRITVDADAGFARATPDPATYRAEVARSTGDGRPTGAGRAGLVATPSLAPSPLLQASGVFDLPQEGRWDSGVLPGEDQDADGIPNLYDVDDDGDLTLDLADPTSVAGPDATASDGPWTTLLQSPPQARNAHTSDVDPASVSPTPDVGPASPASAVLPVTVPLVNGVTTGTVDADRLITAQGQLGLVVWRPQRRALPGEAGGLRDVAALRYGVLMTVADVEFGCRPERYTSLQGLRPGAVGEDRALWPLVDDTSADLPVADSIPIGFTVDVAGCLADAAAAHGFPVPASGSPIAASVAAAGQPLAGGTTRVAAAYSIVAP